MYTDGSKTKHGAGSGYVILSGKDRVLNTQSINLTGEASIFQAELIAIQEAEKYLYTQEDTQGLYIKFFSDSQAALQALKSNKCKVQTVKDTHDTLNSLADQAKVVRLTWIKAQIGFGGNELADEYAKLGTIDRLYPSLQVQRRRGQIFPTLVRGMLRLLETTNRNTRRQDWCRKLDNTISSQDGET